MPARGRGARRNDRPVSADRDRDRRAEAWAEACAPDAADLLALAERARAQLPADVRRAVADVVIAVEELADEATLEALGIEDPFELTAIYEGVPLTERAVSDPPQLPDRVRLFRRAILDEWAARGDVPLGALVRHVLIHELAHHLGWSDDDIAAIDRWWE